MSAKEYNLWKADYLIDPWGEEREDVRAGLIVQSNLSPHSKEPVLLKDCIVNFQPPKKQTWEEQRDMCAAHAAAMIARSKKK